MEIGAKIDVTALPVISYLQLCLCLLIKKSQVTLTKLIPTYVPRLSAFLRDREVSPARKLVLNANVIDNNYFKRNLQLKWQTCNIKFSI